MSESSGVPQSCCRRWWSDEDYDARRQGRCQSACVLPTIRLVILFLVAFADVTLNVVNLIGVDYGVVTVKVSAECGTPIGDQLLARCLPYTESGGRCQRYDGPLPVLAGVADGMWIFVILWQVAMVIVDLRGRHLRCWRARSSEGCVAPGDWDGDVVHMGGPCMMTGATVLLLVMMTANLTVATNLPERSCYPTGLTESVKDPYYDGCRVELHAVNSTDPYSVCHEAVDLCVGPVKDQCLGILDRRDPNPALSIPWTPTATLETYREREATRATIAYPLMMGVLLLNLLINRVVCGCPCRRRRPEEYCLDGIDQS